MDRRVLRIGLGDFDPVQGLFQLGTGLITTGGAVGGAFISADATKYAAREQTKASIEDAIAQTKVAIAGIEAEKDTAALSEAAKTQRTAITAGAAAKSVGFGSAAFAIVAIAALAALALGGR